MTRERRTKSSYNWWAVMMVFLAVFAGILTYAALTETPPFGQDPNFVMFLLGADLVLLLTLGFVIIRRVVALWSGLRHGVAGAKLHVRLVSVFGVLAITPAILMTIFSTMFFHYGVQAWFNTRISTAVNESLVVAEAYLKEHQNVIKADILAMANDLDREAPILIGSQKAYQNFVRHQSLLRNFSEAVVFTSNGRLLAQSGLAFSFAFDERIPKHLLDQSQDGDVVILETDDDEKDRIRALVKLNSYVDTYLYVGRLVDEKVLSHMEKATVAVQDYLTLEGRRSNFQVTITMIFIVAAMLLLLVAVWLGLFFARDLITPIGQLMTASERIRSGDLSARVRETGGDDELAALSKAFNLMTEQLQEQRDALVTANRGLDQRRRFIETVFKGVTSGIIGLNKDLNITLVNTTATEILSAGQTELLGRRMDSVLPQIDGTLKQALEQQNRITQAEIKLPVEDGEPRILLVRVAIELVEDEDMGAVVTFDDITELQAAQRKAAWSGVARRIAHEIKNPLTPIQLSAERLKRKYLKTIKKDPEIFADCVDTIVRHVSDIRQMVDEFSTFARMPEATMREEDIAKLCTQLVIFQKEAHPDITFVSNIPDSVKIDCDPRLVRQAITNLLQNAIDALHGEEGEEPPVSGNEIYVGVYEDLDNVFVVFIDNGSGFPENKRESLLEPYVTTKNKGTGLGLPIVKKIMQDHGGQLLLSVPDAVDKATLPDYNGATISMVFSKERQMARKEDL